MIRYRPTPRANYTRSIFAANSLWPIAASIAQGRSSAKLYLAHELHELLFGHLDLLVGHVTLVSKDRICNTLQVGIGNLAKAQLLERRRQTDALAKLEHPVKLGRTLQAQLHHQTKCHGLAMHGETVAFGLVVQLRLERAPELDRVLEFCQRVGLPTTLEELGLGEISDADLQGVANAVFRNERNMANEQVKVTEQKLVQLMCEV